MITLIAILAGAAFGWYRAGKNGGDRLDRLQYAAVHAIVFGLAALAILILIQRLGVI